MNQIVVFDCEHFDEKVLIYPRLIQTIYKGVFECEEMYFYHIRFPVPVLPFQILQLYFRSNFIHFRYIFCYNFCSLKVEKYSHFAHKVFNNLSTLFSTVQYCSIIYPHPTHILLTYSSPISHALYTIYQHTQQYSYTSQTHSIHIPSTFHHLHFTIYSSLFIIPATYNLKISNNIYIL